MSDSPPIDRHNQEIAFNRAAWERRPALRAVYRRFHGLIASRLAPGVPGAVVELGSGIGAIKETIPGCVTTDVFPNPGVDRVENAYGLAFADGSVSALILFDVWHHLRYPGTALREFRRVLAPGGRVILFEPAISWTGRVVYGFLHPEPLGLGEKTTWEAPPGFTPDQAGYFAAQGAATRLFWRGEAEGLLGGWRLVEATPLASFEYFATAGFSGPAWPGALIGGLRLGGVLRGLDRVAGAMPGLFAARLLVVLAKEGA